MADGTFPSSEPSRPRADWLVVLVDLPPRGAEHLSVEALRRAGARSVSREGERAVAYFRGARDPSSQLRRVEAALSLALPGHSPALSWRWEPWERWAERWRSAHPPRDVGRRFRILPAGSSGSPGAGSSGTAAPPARIPILLEPGVGFGTGEHPTTRSSLRLLEDRIRAGDAVADVGAGSGVLALAAALLGAERVEAFEIDPQAARGARSSVAANGAEDRIRVRIHAVRGDRALPGAPFSGVMANLEGPLLFPLLPALRGALAPAGWLLVSGLLHHERDALLRAPACQGLEVEGEEVEEGWWSGLLVSPGPASHPSPDQAPRPPGRNGR